MSTQNIVLLTSREKLAIRQERNVIDRLSEDMPGDFTENQLSAARIAIRHLFRAGFVSGEVDELLEPLTEVFPSTGNEEVRKIIEASEVVRELARTAYQHGVAVHG